MQELTRNALFQCRKKIPNRLPEGFTQGFPFAQAFVGSRYGKCTITSLVNEYNLLAGLSSSSVWSAHEVLTGFSTKSK